MFLGFLNILAGGTSIAWIHYTSSGGGNNNAIVMFGIVLVVNCIGACSVFYRRRLRYIQERNNAIGASISPQLEKKKK